MDFVYYAPDGSSWESPDVDEIVALIESAGPQYWEFQSATAGLVCLSDGTRTSEMVIMVDGDAGSMLRFCPSGGEDELILTHPGREREEDEVVVYPGGEEWGCLVDTSARRKMRELRSGGSWPQALSRLVNGSFSEAGRVP